MNWWKRLLDWLGWAALMLLGLLVLLWMESGAPSERHTALVYLGVGTAGWLAWTAFENVMNGKLSLKALLVGLWMLWVAVALTASVYRGSWETAVVVTESQSTPSYRLIRISHITGKAEVWDKGTWRSDKADTLLPLPTVDVFLRDAVDVRLVKEETPGSFTGRGFLSLLGIVSRLTL